MRDYKQEIIDRIQSLNETQQMRVLDFVEQLQRPQSISGAEFLDRTKNIRIDAQSAKEMIEAVEEGCEKIDKDEWDFSL